MKRTSIIKNYLFIDTDVFFSTMTSSSSKEILDKLNSKLDEKNTFLILPVVILKEIEKLFENWKVDFFKKTEGNLTVKKILGIEEQLTNSNAKQKKGSHELLNSDLIDKLIKEKRDNLLAEIKKFYTDLSKKFDLILKHKNTIVIELTDELVLNGIKRSLLKKAPYTRSDKITENAHTKDVDCIAFESLLFYLNNEDKVGTKDNLSLCIKDSDYRKLDRTLCEDISSDLKRFSLKDYETIESMLNDSSGVVSKTKKTEQGTPTLNAPGPVIEGSLIVKQNLSESN